MYYYQSQTQLMFSISENPRIYYCPTAENQRESFDGLVGVVQGYIRKDPVSGHLFVFFSRNRKLPKILS